MTLQVFSTQNTPVDAYLARAAISSLVPNGGGLVEPTDYQVTQTSTASMNVNVAAGRAWVDGTSAAHVSGKGYGDQGQYFILNDASAALTVGTPDPTDPRVDVVYVGVNDSYYSGGSDAPLLGIAQGIPTPGASYPANATGIPSNCIAVAWIYVAANVTTITTANITNLNVQLVGPRTSDGWTSVALASGWAAYVGGGNYPSGVLFRALPGGMATCVAMVKSGAAASNIFTFPSQFLPAYSFFANAENNSGPAQVHFDAAGQVVSYYGGSGAPTFLSFQATYSVI